MARGWSDYVASFFESCGVYFPKPLSINSFISFYPFPLIVILFCTIILLLGIKDSARFNIIMTISNILIMLFIIILGSTKINISNWHPFFSLWF